MSDARDVPPRRRGPLDEQSWPARLTAHVTTPGPEPRVHGYEVEADLARHYTFTETVLLGFTGELPGRAQARAFDLALVFLAPVPVNEAPTHGAVIARVCNVFTSALLATTALGLAEQARDQLSRREAAADADERASVGRLCDAARSAALEIPGLAPDLGRTAALVKVLEFAGVRTLEQLEACFVLARLPLAVAEGFATPPHAFRDYPVQLPDIRYEERP